MLASSLYMIQLSLIDIIKFLEILIDVQYVVCWVDLALKMFVLKFS